MFVNALIRACNWGITDDRKIWKAYQAEGGP